MKITAKGQITIPKHIRDQLDLQPGTAVEWHLGDGVALLRKVTVGQLSYGRALVARMRGAAP